MMLEYACTRVRSSALADSTLWNVERRDGGERGSLNVFGRSGGIARMPANTLSFRSGGDAPSGRLRWRARFRHDVTIVDASGATVGEFRVTPSSRTLTIRGAEPLEWDVAFLARRAAWERSGGDTIADIRLAPLFVNAALARVANDVDPRERDVLVYFGLFLLVTGR
jgi:hypothetical protein